MNNKKIKNDGSFLSSYLKNKSGATTQEGNVTASPNAKKSVTYSSSSSSFSSSSSTSTTGRKLKLKKKNNNKNKNNYNNNNNKNNNNNNPIPPETTLTSPASTISTQTKEIINKFLKLLRENNDGRKGEELIERRVLEKAKDKNKFKFIFDKTSAEYKYYEKLKDEIRREKHSSRKRERNRDDEDEEEGEYNEDERRSHLEKLQSIVNQIKDNRDRGKEVGNKSNKEIFLEKNARKFDRKISIHEGGKGHHVDDYIPEDVLKNFYESAKKKGINDPAMKLVSENKKDEKQPILETKNVGTDLLGKMGYDGKSGLGVNGEGIVNPIEAKGQGNEKIGVGAARNTHDVEEGDDIFDVYKKRMMLAYRFRPNPLNNPRKNYY